MFGFTLIHKRELATFNVLISDLKEQRDKLLEQVELERRRADAAFNAFLITREKVAVTPTPKTMTDEEEEQMKDKMLNLFGDEYTQDEILEKLQNDRS